MFPRFIHVAACQKLNSVLLGCSYLLVIVNVVWCWAWWCTSVTPVLNFITFWDRSLPCSLATNSGSCHVAWLLILDPPVSVFECCNYICAAAPYLALISVHLGVYPEVNCWIIWLFLVFLGNCHTIFHSDYTTNLLSGENASILFNQLLLLFCLFISCWDKIFLCSPACLGTHHIAQASLKLVILLS